MTPILGSGNPQKTGPKTSHRLPKNWRAGASSTAAPQDQGACDLVSLPSHGWGPHSGVSEETVCYLWALTLSASFFDPSFGPAKSAPFCLARCPDLPDHASDDQERKPGYTEEQDVSQTRRKRFTRKANYHMFRRRSLELSCKLRHRTE